MGGFPGAPNPTSGPAGPVGVTGEALVYLGEVITVFGGEFAPVGVVIAFIGELLELLADIINALISLFSGRPREEATIQTAAGLMKGRNPAGQVYGVLLYRLLHDYDIVLSSQNPLLNLAAKQFGQNLLSQGISRDRARAILAYVDGRIFQADQALPRELKQPLPDGMQVYGTARFLQVYTDQLQKYVEQGYYGDKASQKALRWAYVHADVHDLLGISFIAGNQTNPTPPPPAPPPTTPPPIVPPIGPQTCPPGYTFDPLTKLCVISPLGGPSPQPGGQPGPIPPPPAPQDGGDELTDCCNLTATYLYYIASAIQNFSPASAGAAGGDCCTQVVDAIGAVAEALGGIASALPSAASAGAGPLDLSPISDALAQLTAAISGLPAGFAPNTQPLVDAIDRLTQQIAAQPEQDLSFLKPLVDGYPDLDAEIEALEQYLVQNGFISSEVAQVSGA